MIAELAQLHNSFCGSSAILSVTTLGKFGALKTELWSKLVKPGQKRILVTVSQVTNIKRFRY